MALPYRSRAYLLTKDPRLVEALDDITSHLEGVMNQTNTAPKNGTVLPPPAPSALTVSSNGGIFDAAIHDNNSPVVRGVNYFLEYSTTPAFSRPTQIDLGASRNWRGHLGNQNLYWRAYSSYPTSEKSGYAYHGGAAQPMVVQGGGTISGPNIQPSNGSGTSQGSSASDGGFGNNPFRGTSRPITVR